MLRVLFLSDTHLGFDLPWHPRVERRRRGPDFFTCYHAALEPARAGRVDVVVHGGDLFFRSRVPAQLVERALAPLRALAAAGVEVLLVPGNHERAQVPRPLLALEPRLHVFRAPSTVVVERGGLRVAFAGFPYQASVRRAFPAVLAATRYREAAAAVNVLVMHHAFEGATCGPAFTFRAGDDVVAAADLPADLAVVLSGHIHRHQVLRRDLAGRPLKAPVVYAGSVERTSFAEQAETKGYVLLGLDRGGAGGRMAALGFRPLPARPMHVVELAGPASALPAALAAALARLPPEAVVQVRVAPGLAAEAARVLRAETLRTVGGPHRNVTLALPRSA